MKKTSYKVAKDHAWKAFSLYIRSKYYKNGQCECYTCEHKFPIGKITAGHGIPGRTNAVLFMEEVVRPQCVACNVYRGGRYDVFTPKLMDELGIKKYKELAQKANKTIKFTTEQLLEIEQKYIEKIWKLEK